MGQDDTRRKTVFYRQSTSYILYVTNMLKWKQFMLRQACLQFRWLLSKMSRNLKHVSMWNTRIISYPKVLFIRAATFSPRSWEGQRCHATGPNKHYFIIMCLVKILCCKSGELGGRWIGTPYTPTNTFVRVIFIKNFYYQTRPRKNKP
jgi:hypothetical protein